jgi:hypothetical protein
MSTCPLTTRCLALLAAFTASAIPGSSPATAGSLNACDEARIAVRGAIADAYRPVLAELDRQVVRAKVMGVDPCHMPLADTAEATHARDLLTIRTSLEEQEAKDVGPAESRLASDCRTGLGPVAQLANAAARQSAATIAATFSSFGFAPDAPAATSAAR